MPTPRYIELPKWHKIPLCYPAMPSTGKTSRTILEIGPGRGDFLFHLAENEPDASIIGIEIKSQRYFKLVERITKRGLSNVRIIQADAREGVKNMFGPESIDEVHINFPDPWPKKRHTKNRLMNEDFMKNCTRILKAGGFVSFITDAKSYAEDVTKNFSRSEGLDFSLQENASVFPTFFAQKWKKEGRKFYWMKWIKQERRP